jgi:hypothetical protein
MNHILVTVVGPLTTEALGHPVGQGCLRVHRYVIGESGGSDDGLENGRDRARHVVKVPWWGGMKKKKREKKGFTGKKEGFF